MKRGFTLFEMIVAIGVFSIIVVISLGSFLTITNAQKKAVSFRAVQDNLNFALEMMSKSIRVGFNYSCLDDTTMPSQLSDYTYNISDCSSGGNVFIFQAIDKNGSQITKAYRINGKQIETASPETNNYFIPLTSNDVEITKGSFYVDGAPSSDGKQPRVTIVLTGAAGKAGKIQSEARLQTTISQRKLDS